MECPVPLHDRAATPLFVDDSGKRLERQQLDGVLKQWMKQSAVDDVTHSWHSFRIVLAVGLKGESINGSMGVR